MNFSCNLTKKKIALSFVTLLITIFTLAEKIEAQAAPAAPTTESTQTTEAPAETPAPVAEAPAEAPQQESEIGLVKLFVTGGWSMWPLLLSSIVGFGVILERMYFFFTAKLIRKGYNQDLQDAIDASGMNGIEEFLKANEGQKITDVLKNGMEVSQNDPEIFAAGIEREAGEVMTLLEKGLTVLSAVSTIAPLVGFLGTVSGMINAFDAIANADQVNAKVVAGGIKEALITTAAGLIVAIPAMTFYQYLQGRVAFFTSEVEEAANKIYKEYLKLKAGKRA
ncbi:MULTISPECIES: MotA/TolQ/ExbB proton channel family protein [Leptospira]|uniref:MotA/TolQ/ExbB proton channel family protein n=2 Tax=Leptospira TaxID=171 RepID=A0AAW5VI87_9LEPT|nr:MULTISPECIES: MotA/TolQ/ExbB proton channel family protein [Leptospira]MCG6143816.1 MotA/TolQ/ExbB proton channel family protein [Leptospira bandrabouensis]MCG6151144.1 MotA/TolQ/ExbB proton channel family protein [Leptospira bandrabouensis]MCG6159476.1 MotA/TolQ/ExbB proton channel family protein [Leptospira bandrabouensis]MCG6163410.1 MotA/TolQ/ExbB proton channel family protein [Leptospira bandrabouensis]MCW7457330.1 MotA/TolQ/ExbB proton channel family protein [Leptospira bandrabouensis